MNKFQTTSILNKSCIYYLSTIAVTCSTEVPTTRVSVSGLGGPDYSSWCGVPPVGSSWSPGGTHSAFYAAGGLPVYTGGRWNHRSIIRTEEKGWGVGFNLMSRLQHRFFFNHLKDLWGQWKLTTPNVFI